MVWGDILLHDSRLTDSSREIEAISLLSQSFKKFARVLNPPNRSSGVKLRPSCINKVAPHLAKARGKLSQFQIIILLEHLSGQLRHSFLKFILFDQLPKLTTPGMKEATDEISYTKFS